MIVNSAYMLISVYSYYTTGVFACMRVKVSKVIYNDTLDCMPKPFSIEVIWAVLMLCIQSQTVPFPLG